MKTLLVTGGCGFIGSAFIRMLLQSSTTRIVNLDKLTYAGLKENIPAAPIDRYQLVVGDVTDKSMVTNCLREHRPDAIVHFAAETHVDRSIDGPAAFVQTNVVGTVNLMESCLEQLMPSKPIRFIHVSTDEVYGSLGPTGRFTEEHPHAPNSPYAASKSAADMLVRSFFRTYQLPTISTHCGNNFGPHQFPEKLIPLMILNAAEGRTLPVYGDGGHVRDWLHVDDHCRALHTILERGEPGQTYNIGAAAEQTNLQLVRMIADLVDARLGKAPGTSRQRIQHVDDRPGHDRRYAIDAGKLQRELGWKPLIDCEAGLASTVDWYLSHDRWVQIALARGYDRERLGQIHRGSPQR